MGMKGRYDAFVYILNNTDNIEIEDCEGGIDCFKTTIIRKSTNEEFNITLKEDVVPEGFFELMKKAKMKNISDDEYKELKTKFEEFRNNLLTKTNQELFEYKIKEKASEQFSLSNAIYGVIIIGVMLIIIGSMILFIKKSP